jgi:glucose/mannose-6-phosphate isomerase
MLNLNNLSEIKSADPSGYLPILQNTPNQIKSVWEEFKKTNYPIKDFNKIIVCAMGGSAIGADMAKFLVEKYSKLPIQIVRDYNLPNWVDQDTLAIIISYSGNTEETLSGYIEAAAKKAQMFCLASGGKLLELAKQNNHDYFILPPNMPPRTAWGHSFFIVLELLIKFDVLNPTDIKLSESITAMEKAVATYQEDQLIENNIAKQIAGSLVGSIPIVFGAEHLAVVARRLKGEFNENTKIPAYYEEIPALNHNAQQGLECFEELKKAIKILILKSDLYHERNQTRADIIKQTFTKQGFDMQTIQIFGDNFTSSICQGVILGDYVSVYLAFLLGKDPVPFTAIEELKGMLQTGEYVEKILNQDSQNL